MHDFCCFLLLLFSLISETLATTPRTVTAKTALRFVAEQASRDYTKHKKAANHQADEALHSSIPKDRNRRLHQKMASYDARDKAVDAAKVNHRIASVLKGVDTTERPPWLNPNRAKSLILSYEHTDGTMYWMRPWRPSSPPQRSRIMHATRRWKPNLEWTSKGPQQIQPEQAPIVSSATDSRDPNRIPRHNGASTSSRLSGSPWLSGLVRPSSNEQARGNRQLLGLSEPPRRQESPHGTAKAPSCFPKCKQQ